MKLVLILAVAIMTAIVSINDYITWKDAETSRVAGLGSRVNLMRGSAAAGMVSHGSLSPDEADFILTIPDGKGETGVIYVVHKHADGMCHPITKTRFDETNVNLEQLLFNEIGHFLDEYRCQESVNTITDFSVSDFEAIWSVNPDGARVLSSAELLDVDLFPDNSYLVAEMDESEIYAPLRQRARALMRNILITLIFAIVAAYVIYRLYEKQNQVLYQLNVTVDKLQVYLYLVRHDLANKVIQANRSLKRVNKKMDMEALPKVISASLEIASIQTEQGSELLKGLMQLSKTDELNLTTFNLETELREHINSTRYTMTKLGELGEATGDKSVLINSVFKNLIENGYKYNKSNSPLVKITREGNVITIKDNGSGIAVIDGVFNQEEYERLCRPKQRGNEGKGTGLGLYIAIEILKAHEWSLDVEASSLGTTFSITMKG